MRTDNCVAFTRGLPRDFLVSDIDIARDSSYQKIVGPARCRQHLAGPNHSKEETSSPWLLQKIPQRRAGAQVAPKPKPGSIASLKRKRDDLKAAIETAERELDCPDALMAKPDSAERAQREPEDLEDLLREVRIWASVASDLATDLPVPHGSSHDEHLQFTRLIRVIDQVERAAEEVWRVYQGWDDDDGVPADVETQGRAA